MFDQSVPFVDSVTSWSEQNTICEVSVEAQAHFAFLINSVFVLLYRNLPFEISTEEMYDIFGKYGAIRQIRLWVTFVNIPS